MNERYVNSLIGSYNKQQAPQFGRKGAAKKFLGPWDLQITQNPPSGYGNNKAALKHEEFSLFAALHFMRYRLTKSKRKNFHRYLNIYLALRNRAISANWRLVHSSVSRLKGKTHDVDGLIDRSYEALISAVDKFDPWRGYKFSTYACSAIYRRMWREMKRKVLVSLEIFDIPTETEDENEALWLERLTLILRGQNSLNRQEAQALFYRFYESRTLELASIAMKVSKERVRQIQKRAIKKLKDDLNQNPILSGKAI